MAIWQSRAQEVEAGKVYTGFDQTETGHEFVWNAQDQLVKRHLGGVEEIHKSGAYGNVFRFGLYEFPSLRGAISFYINHLSRLQASKDPVEIEGKVRLKTRDEIAQEIREVLASVEENLVSQLSAVLQRDGAFRGVLCLPEGRHDKESHLESGGKDLAKRLLEVFGNDQMMLLAWLIKPEIFKKAIETLPPGQSEAELLAEEKSIIESDRQKRANQISEARAFLKKLD
jgi:hypothetical protein